MRGNGLGAWHDARIGGEEARDVRPVLVEISLQALGEDGAGDVAAAAVEQLDAALLGGAVKTGHHKAALAGVLLDELRGAAHGEGPVVMEGDHIRRVDERQAQVLGHQARGEILAAAHELLGGVAARAGALGERGELVADGIAEPPARRRCQSSAGRCLQAGRRTRRGNSRARRPNTAGR